MFVLVQLALALCFELYLTRSTSHFVVPYKLRKETALAARANIQAKETADQLAAALGKNGRPTQEMIANYQKAKTRRDWHSEG